MHVVSQKQAVVQSGIQHVTGVGMKIHDETTLQQMTRFITLPNDVRGGFGPADEDAGGHDDHVMALGLAITGHFLEPPLPAYFESPESLPPKARVQIA